MPILAHAEPGSAASGSAASPAGDGEGSASEPEKRDEAALPKQGGPGAG